MELIEAAALDDVVIQEFASGLHGRILRAGDADYDVARRHYNALINKHPALIVQCTGVADVNRRRRLCPHASHPCSCARRWPQCCGESACRRWHGH